MGTLRSLGFDIVDPYAPEHQAACRAIKGRRPMGYFQALAVTADLIAFRAFPDGHVGAGLVAEMAAFLTAKPGGPVIELPADVRKRALGYDETAGRNAAIKEWQ